MRIANTQLRNLIINTKEARPVLEPGNPEMRKWHLDFESTVTAICQAHSEKELKELKHIFTFGSRKDYVEIEFKNETVIIGRDE